MDERLKRKLIEIGLTENEALVYDASLTLGATTAIRLSQTTEIKRSTVYSILESLNDKGLMHTESVGLRRKFAPGNPERLESIIERRKGIVKDILPELSARFLGIHESDSFIKHYRGMNGIRTVYDSLLGGLKPGDFYLVISDEQKWIDTDREYFNNFRQQRAQLGLDIRLLLQDSESARRSVATQRQLHQQVKILPQQTSLSTNMIVVPDKVIIVQTTKPLLAMVIENQNIVQMNRVFFQIIWNSIPASGN